MFVFCVHLVEVLNAEIWMTFSLLMLVDDARDSKRHRQKAAELSRQLQAAVQTSRLASRPCGPDGWLALLLIKASVVETNPGPITAHRVAIKLN